MGLFVPAGYDPELLSHPQLGHLLAEFAQTYAEHLQAHGVFSIGDTAPSAKPVQQTAQNPGDPSGGERVRAE